MAATKPVLGYVPCTKTGCDHSMRVTERKSGRGGANLMLMGYCTECKTSEQRKDAQEYLEQYVDYSKPQPKEPEPAALGDFDPNEIDSPSLVRKPVKKAKAEEPEAASGGGFRLVIGGLAILAVALGAGALIKH